jgi:hypothetical protein
MIISDIHNYLFIELPRTGTSAISKELIQNYEGKEILTKHATYKEFLRIATPEQKNYYVFSCVRNPIDRMVSFYVKCKTGFYDNRFDKDYKMRYFDKYYLIPRVKFIKENNSTFCQYLKKFHKWPYVDWSVLDHNRFNNLIRFENLNKDFIKVLTELGIEVKRDLPKVNATSEKKDFTYYLDSKCMNTIDKVFGPALLQMNYSSPFANHNIKYSSLTSLKYFINRSIKSIYWRYIKKYNP